MKKYIFILFALLLPSVALTSCGDDEPDNPGSSSNDSDGISGSVSIAQVAENSKLVANVSGKYYDVTVKTTLPLDKVAGISLYYGTNREYISTPLASHSQPENRYTVSVKLPRKTTVYLQARAYIRGGGGDFKSSKIYTVKTK